VREAFLMVLALRASKGRLTADSRPLTARESQKHPIVVAWVVELSTVGCAL